MTENQLDIAGVASREAEKDQRAGLPIDQRALLDMFYRLEMSVANATGTAATARNYIPFSHLSFYKALRQAAHGRRPAELSFLELGCGLGTKLHIARYWAGIGRVAGIEMNPEYVAVARQMVCFGAEVIVADALTFDAYHDYDILYCLFREDATSEPRTHDLSQTVREKMKPGAVLLAATYPYGIETWQKPIPNAEPAATEG